MNFNDITFARMQAQQLSQHKLKKPGDLVNHFGAVQSQDFLMAQWALGVRLPGSTQKTIEQAINKGQILRTHVLRPTWHFVSPQDIGWMMDLTARSLRSSVNARERQLGLTAKLNARACSLIEKTIGDNGPQTREELMETLKNSKIDTSENRSSHILFIAEIEKLICSGPMKNKKTTYALFSDQAKKSESLTREEALAKLALKYFTSHYPATIKDFCWWGGINQGDARKGVEANRKFLSEEKIGTEVYWLPRNYKPVTLKENVVLLPTYDEFTIAYKNRTPSLNQKHHKKVISTNGIFYPLILINGKVEGMWKKSTDEDSMKIQLKFFSKPDKKTSQVAWEQAEKYARFMGKTLVKMKK